LRFVYITFTHLSPVILSTEEVVSHPSLSSHGSQVAIVGIGGAGNNLLSQAIDGGISPRNCVAVNTDRGQLSESRAQNKVLLADSSEADSQLSRLGNGHDRLLAHRVAPFTQESDFTILLAGLGGATGTRAAPLIAQWHKDQVRPVVSVVALPFIHERERRFVALRGLKKMVESCDCTVIVDNSVQKRALLDSKRVADETAALAVRGLSEVVATSNHMTSHQILNILSLGQLATVCFSPVQSREKIQSAVAGALTIPSAELPLSKAKGAVLLFRGIEPLNVGQAAHAYEAIASLVGHEVDFVHVSTKCQAESSLSIFLSGYTYDMALGTIDDLIEDLYDMEYGLESTPTTRIGVRMPLYEMELV
jgi:cell division GTPase FtsZ